MTDLTTLLGTTDLTTLQDRLATAATRDGIADITYRTYDSPIGSLLLAATEQGLVQVAFAVEDLDGVLDRLATLVSPRVLAAPARLDPVATELDEYFAGRRRRFAVALDLRLSHGFRRAVLEHLSEIGYGRTESYTEVAAAAGSPRAVRAVGSACATNPVPIVLPCHRVLRADGSLGGYRGGADAKRVLLELESGSSVSSAERASDQQASIPQA